MDSVTLEGNSWAATADHADNDEDIAPGDSVSSVGHPHRPITDNRNDMPPPPPRPVAPSSVTPLSDLDALSRVLSKPLLGYQAKPSLRGPFCPIHKAMARTHRRSRPTVPR